MAFGADGRPAFNELQNYDPFTTSLAYYLFDLPQLAGKSLLGKPPHERHKLLCEKVIPRLEHAIFFSESFDGPAGRVVDAVKAQGLEGVVAKRSDSLYEPGRRSGAWVKLSVNRCQELVIGGYVSSGKNFDSLIVGYYADNELNYVARVRNGFVPEVRSTVFKRFPRPRYRHMPVRQPAAEG